MLRGGADAPLFPQSKHLLATTTLHPQLHHRGSAPAFILRRFGYRFHMRVILQILPQRLPQDSHAAAVHYAHSRQAGQKRAVYEFFNLPRGIVDGAADDVDLRRYVRVFCL